MSLSAVEPCFRSPCAVSQDTCENLSAAEYAEIPHLAFAVFQT